MPTINDLHVDAVDASGDITSPISQDPALDATFTQPSAADKAKGIADAADGSADVCPAVLTGVYQCPKVKNAVVQHGKVSWLCHWCGKWFAVRHPTRALCHVTRTKMRKGISPCSGNIDPESSKRYVCYCVIQYCFVLASVLFT